MTMPGAATPSFAPRVKFSADQFPRSIAAADVNGDGKPDLVLVDFSSNTASVLLNTTTTGAITPSFAGQVSFATGNYPNSVTLADVNGDGKPDVIVADVNSGAVSVLLNATTPGAAAPDFVGKVDFQAGNEPFAVAAADLNGDGRLDVAVAGISSPPVNVLLNTPEVITNATATGTIIESDPQPTAQFSTPSETVAWSRGELSASRSRCPRQSGVNTTIPFMLGGTAAMRHQLQRRHGCRPIRYRGR